MEEEKKVKCENCKVEIAESKLAIHQGFCLQNNKYCPTCSKVFLSTEFEEHLKTHNVPNKDTKKVSEHRRNCPCAKHGYTNQEPPKKVVIPQKKEEPKKKVIKVDDSLGFGKCEFCENMFENLKEHLEVCEIKKYIEEEQKRYLESVQARLEEDNRIAKDLAKVKEMDSSHDIELAKKLQEEYEKNKIMDDSKDVEIAKKLQEELEKNKIMDNEHDLEIARRLQEELDAKLAKDLERENANQAQPLPTDIDDDVRRAIEESKKDLK